MCNNYISGNEIPSIVLDSFLVPSGLCQTWSKFAETGFRDITTRLIQNLSLSDYDVETVVSFILQVKLQDNQLSVQTNNWFFLLLIHKLYRLRNIHIIHRFAKCCVFVFSVIIERQLKYILNSSSIKFCKNGIHIIKYCT